MGLLAAAGEVQRLPQIKGKAAKGLAEFAAMMQNLAQLREAPAAEVIKAVIDKSGYRQMLLQSHDAEDADRLANIEELITAAHEFASEDGANTLPAFLEHITLVSDVDDWDEEQDQVSIMTLHAAKGLEFPVVFMPAVEQNILPHERSIQNPDELEEERRLAFVGMTRAEEELYLCNAQMREFRGTTLYTIRSPFLDELPPEVKAEGIEGFARSPMYDKDRFDDEDYEEARYRRQARKEFRAGTRAKPQAATAVPGADYEGFSKGVVVKHKTYGFGKVVEVSGSGSQRKVKVRFATEGDRTFVIGVAPLEVVK
jgi:DNA helicase-2/ATP-dependent DNA helicase PcrA